MTVNNRYKAFSVHLLLSILILIILISIIFFIWYPNNLIYAGGTYGLKILIGVDLILGPLLTLIVFDKKKKSLKLDLTIIAIIQLSCLLAGLWLIYNERPLTQVLYDEGVYLIAASDYKYYNIERPKLPGKYPKNVFLTLPKDFKATQLIRAQVLSSHLGFRDDLYTPMSKISDEQFKEKINHITSNISQRDRARLLELVKPNNSCEWIPINSKNVPGFACFNQTDGIIDLSDKSLN